MTEISGFCLRKTKLAGIEQKVDAKDADDAFGKLRRKDERFDWTNLITTKFIQESVPVHRRECINESTGQLNSFRLVMKGEDLSKNIITDSVGPSELGDCSNKPAPLLDHPSRAVIYADEERIQGVEFAYGSINETLMIGKRDG